MTQLRIFEEAQIRAWALLNADDVRGANVQLQIMRDNKTRHSDDEAIEALEQVIQELQ